MITDVERKHSTYFKALLRHFLRKKNLNQDSYHPVLRNIVYFLKVSSFASVPSHSAFVNRRQVLD